VSEPVAGKRLGRLGVGGIAVGLIIVAAVAFILFSFLGDRASAVVDTAAGKQFSCTVQSVYDGDGPINCAEFDTEGKPVRVRLRGIEARDADNGCQLPDPLCPTASGAQAKAALTRIAVGRLQCTSFGPSYDRVDSSCVAPDGTDLSCELIRTGMAVRWPQYDPEGRLVPCVPPRG
jgi:endonuclease YncB( thermonuclease family)